MATALFALRCLKYLPTPYTDSDSNRVTLAYFGLSCLALLPSPTPGPEAAIDSLLRPSDRAAYSSWVWSLYDEQSGGFKGSDSLAGNGEPVDLIQTYTALACLALLRDESTVQRLNGGLRDKIGLFVASCQDTDGSFSQYPLSAASTSQPIPKGDSRTTYSAFCILSFLSLLSPGSTPVNVPAALAYLLKLQRPDGAFAQFEGLESQGGTTFCVLASFEMARAAQHAAALVPRHKQLVRWLMARLMLVAAPTSEEDSEDGEALRGGSSGEEDDEVLDEVLVGLQGRPNKPADACYTFWVLGALSLLPAASHPPLPALPLAQVTAHLTACLDPLSNGIAREIGAHADLYHTGMAVAALALLKQELSPGDPKRLEVGWVLDQKTALWIRDSWTAV